MTCKTLDYTIAISKEELAEFPRVEYYGSVKIVDTKAEMVRAIKILKKYDILGFDTESRPTFKKGATIHVSLIQIAADDICFLFRIRKIEDISPLRELIDDPNILKIGLSLRDDFNMLSHDYNFKPQGFIDLQKLVVKYKFSSCSLQKIYAILFNQRITKRQQLSNWNAPTLTEAQMHYAAIDAWACIQIYKKLEIEGFDPDMSKYKVYKTEEDEEI